MTSFLHLLPLALFFISYKLYDIYVATLALMITTSIVFPLGWYLHKKINRNEIVMLGFIITFGTATLFFHNANFIMWKVSIIFWALSIFALGNRLINKNSTTFLLLGENIHMSTENWVTLDNYLITYGLIMGTVNWIIFTYLPEATWVNFKTFGLLAASIVFSIIMAIHISRNAKSIKQ